MPGLLDEATISRRRNSRLVPDIIDIDSSVQNKISHLRRFVSQLIEVVVRFDYDLRVWLVKSPTEFPSPLSCGRMRHTSPP